MSGQEGRDAVRARTAGRRDSPPRALLLLLAVLMAGLTACGGGEESAEPQATSTPASGETSPDDSLSPDGTGSPAESGEAAGPPETTDLTFGILPTPDYAPVVIAVNNGYFAGEGLNVTTEMMSPGGAVPGVVGGSLHVAGVNWLTFLTAINEGVPLYAVAEADRGVPDYAQLLVRADSDIQSLADLVGKKVAVISSPGNCDLIPNDALREQGVEGTPEYVNLAIPDMPGTLERGGVDAACVPQPLLGSLKESGDFRPVFDLFDEQYEGFPIVGFSTSQEFQEDNPNTVAAVRRALARAQQLVQDDEDSVRQVLPEYTSFSPEQAEALVLPMYPVGIDPSALQQPAELMNRLGFTDEVVEVPGAESGLGS